jgi:AcrR family transcriptional regulator
MTSSNLIAAMYLEGEVPAALPRHRHGLARETVRASQALRILSATAEVVAEKGYAAASVAAIVERAGVSTKAFYELYRDKEEALLAAYAAIDVVVAKMTAAAAAHEDPREMVGAGVAAYLEALAAEPAFTRMLVIEAVGAGPRVLERRRQAFGDLVGVVRTVLGDPAPDDAILLALLGGINELVLQHLLERDAASLPELQPQIDELIGRVCFPG